MTVEHNDKNRPNDDADRKREADDRLIDWGLRKLASDETAPDLSNRILSASTQTVIADRSDNPATTIRRAKSGLYRRIAILGVLFGLAIFGYSQLPEAQRAYVASNPQSTAAQPVRSPVQPTRRPVVRLRQILGYDTDIPGLESMATAPQPLTVNSNGKKVRLVLGSKTVMDLQERGYMVQVPTIVEREEKYTVKIPVKKTRQEKRTITVDGKAKTRVVDVEYTELVSEVRTRRKKYTVMKPETRSREVRVPRVVTTQKLVDEDGLEIALNTTEGRRLVALLEAQIAESKQRDAGRDRYEPIHENPFVLATGTDAVSTFSIDVDTASYTNVRQYLRSQQLPPANAVRIEELVNYFQYDYAAPDENGTHPFAADTEVAECPWNAQHKLVRIGVKGKEVANEQRPLSNIVFLVDVSGSMNEPNKLPLVIEGLTHMAKQLGENDRVAIVVYASSEGLALPSTRGDQQDVITEALNRLSAGGSTAGGAGINLAYKIAEENFIKGGSNRVILCTDGDFNVGVTNKDDLTHLAKTKAADTGVFLTVLGFGRGNLNDAMMEKISNSGNGNYHYIDNLREARRVLVQQLSGTLVTIAKDVKIQVEFNPANVAAYRLLGYENRLLAREAFNDDTKDAGEVGAGHTVTALYEVVPAGVDVASVKNEKKLNEEPLKYQVTENDSTAAVAESNTKEQAKAKPEAKFTDELLTLRLRYKQPTESTSTKIEFSVPNTAKKFATASTDFRFATSVVGFGMLLRNSAHQGSASFQSVRNAAAESLGEDRHGYRTEFLELIDAARELK